MKGLGAAAGSAVALSHDRGFARNAEAIAPLVGAGLVAGSVGVGWALREFEIVGADPPAEGLTGDTLKQQIYQVIKTRKSTNASTIVDNQNILDGIEHNAYTEAKVAAIEELNAGSTESAVLSAATSAIGSYEETVKKNLLKSWNESALEFDTLFSQAESHSDLSVPTLFQASGLSGIEPKSPPIFDKQVELSPGGTTFTVKTLQSSAGTDTTQEWNPAYSHSDDGNDGWDIHYKGGSSNITYLNYDVWGPIWDEMDTKFQNVRDGISIWVDSVYGDVQSGDIEIDDLVTPRERAAMMSDGEGTSQAIADLIALNVPVDAEREATITIDSTGATLRGTFALTDSSDGPIESGTTYDPSTFTGDVYLTTDMSLVEGDWSAINTSVDGGTITITEEPYEGTAIEVTTAASETVSVPAADWTDNGDGTWSYDASGDLETNITNVDSARFVSTATETQYETLQLDGSFTVDKLMNTQSGEEVSTTSFSNSEPQTDSNYITQEEWENLEQQNKELIEKYENSQSGGGIDLGQFDMFGIPGEIVAVGAAALVALGILGN